MKEKKQINIFIVEDNQLFSMALKTFLETVLTSQCSSNFIQRNIRVHTFETGEICMENFKEINPQIVILDYHLNNKSLDAADGIKVLDWIKKENKETNVVILTNEDNLDIAKKSFKHGASDYVVKTDTQFDKINYSLHNLFKMIEAKRETKKYKMFFLLFLLLIALLVGVVITIQIFFPSIFK